MMAKESVAAYDGDAVKKFKLTVNIIIGDVDKSVCLGEYEVKHGDKVKITYDLDTVEGG